MEEHQNYGIFNNMVWGTGALTVLSTIFISTNSYLVNKILETIIIGPGKTRFYKNKKNVTIDTESGEMLFPTVKLPNLDWEVHIIDNHDIEDGSHEMDKLNEKEIVKSLKTCRDRLICEYMYPEDIDSVNLKLCIVSPFDSEIYTVDLKKGEPINYKMHIENFTEILEN